MCFGNCSSTYNRLVYDVMCYSRKNLAVTRGGSIPLQGVQYHPYSHLEHEDISPVR